MDKKKKKAQNGYVIPEQQVYAQQMYQPQMGIQQPYPIPYNQYPPQATPIPQSSFAPMDYTSADNTPDTNYSPMNNISNGIGSAAKTIGGIFDTIGDIRRGIITGGSSLLNALIPDNQKSRKRTFQFVNSQDPYGNQTYNNMFENGGSININPAHKGLFTAKAKEHNMNVQEYANYVLSHKDDFNIQTERQAQFAHNFNGKKAENGVNMYNPYPIARSGATVTNYGFGQPIEGLTPIQQAVLNGQVAPTSIEDVTPTNQPIPLPINQPNYYSFLPSGQFQMNIPRFLEDRIANSGYIGDNYSYHTNRSFGYEGIYGNRDYIPTMQAGGTIEVSDANDPRYKAYQDSLAANRLSNSIIRTMRNINPGHDDWVRVGPKSAFGKPLTQKEADKESERVNHWYSTQKEYIEAFNPAGNYKNWPASMYIGYRVPGDNNFDKNGKMFPAYSYYPPPKQAYVLAANKPQNINSQQNTQPIYQNPPVRAISPLESRGFNIENSKPEATGYSWQNVLNQGEFPVYGSDNNLQGTWDTTPNGEIQWYPRNLSDTSIPTGLPSNTLIGSPTSIQNVRRLKNGGELSASKASKILHEGKANGKKLTEKQRKYFGWVANGSKAQDGTMINNTGYLDGTPTADNPMNIIPSNYITMNGVSEGIMANGNYLPPNSGDYLFPTQSVVEEKIYTPGRSYNLTKKQIEDLKARGYEFE